MADKSLMFWTDAVQAQERLAHSAILYDDAPFYVERIGPGKEGIGHVLIGYLYPKGESTKIPLDDPRLHKYRKLPPLGWINSATYKAAIFLARRCRRSRQHGLSSDNVGCSLIAANGVVAGCGYTYEDVLKDVGYELSCRNEYPAMEEVLSAVKPNSSLAISLDYAIYRDTNGLRWLYRKMDRIGLFSGIGTLLLFEKFSFLKEELNENSVITVKEIQEF